MSTTADAGEQVSGPELLRRVAEDIVGRRRQIACALAVLDAGRDLLLEGPPGTGKSTILRSIARHRGVPITLVEGNGDLTPAKLTGHHDPAQVMRRGYQPEDFVAGPLPQAMRDGGLLFLEEFNRIPEETLNVLLGAMAERRVVIPRVGVVQARHGFRIIAAMNPFDNVGTMRVSVSVLDRLCRVVIDYQSEIEERAVVQRESGGDEALVARAVALTRATRDHPLLRSGASVRGAIDLVLVAERLAVIEPDDGSEEPLGFTCAAMLALSSKVTLDHGAGDRTVESVLAELIDAT